LSYSNLLPLNADHAYHTVLLDGGPDFGVTDGPYARDAVLVDEANADEAHYTSFKCPFFPDGYALPKDLMIKFFSVRTHYTFGHVQKIVVNVDSNRDLGAVRFKLYSGIPLNPLAVAMDFLPPTAEAEGEWHEGGQVVFDDLDITIPPGFPQPLLVKAESDDLDDLGRGDWAEFSIDIYEDDGSVVEATTSRQVKYLY
jgi:hypothetical protein